MNAADRIIDERLGRIELHAPAVADEARRSNFRDDQKSDQSADGGMAEITGVQPPEERNNEADQDRFGHLVERCAVKAAAQTIWPQEEREGRASPERPSQRGSSRQTRRWPA